MPMEKTDSGWLRNDYYVSSQRPQMRALYADEACKIQNGNCLYYYANGFPSLIGRRVNNKEEGICMSYHSNGMMADSAVYHNGQVC